MSKGENEPIGILLCARKNDAVVKYTLPEGRKQIFVSKYVQYLPTEEELKAELLREKEVIEMEFKLNKDKQ
ncbi:MAG: PDDEXK nuclease domain-containing protein [Deltaproteobacteria bacterium]